NWFGRQYGSCVTSTATDTYPTSGLGKSLTGRLAAACSMNTRQISAGHVPPKTVIRVVGGIIDTCPRGNPTHTAAVSCGIAPTNQAFEWSMAVPVLPICGRPMLAAVPVPYRTTFCRIRSTTDAILGSSKVMLAELLGSAFVTDHTLPLPIGMSIDVGDGKTVEGEIPSSRAATRA